MKVLIAEGSPEVMERLMTLIQEIPTAELIVPTATAHATLESVRTSSPDVLVLDAHIPDARGLDLLKTIRREKPALALIILSNVVYPQSCAHYEAAGADLFVDKSHEFLHLQQCLRELTCRPQVEVGRTSDNSIRRRLALTRTGFKTSAPKGGANRAQANGLGFG